MRREMGKLDCQQTQTQWIWVGSSATLFHLRCGRCLSGSKVSEKRQAKLTWASLISAKAFWKG